MGGGGGGGGNGWREIEANVTVCSVAAAPAARRLQTDHSILFSRDYTFTPSSLLFPNIPSTLRSNFPRSPTTYQDANSPPPPLPNLYLSVVLQFKFS